MSVTSMRDYDWDYSPTTPDQLRKWMRLARFVKDNEKPCLSRNIGVIIVDPATDSVISTGHNGPPGDLPPCDEWDYLERVVTPQLTPQELALAVRGEGKDEDLRDRFVKENHDCGICPRKLIGAPSGQRLELCTCIHGEVDAVTKARRPLFDCWMVCACGVPCVECTKVILDARLETVVAVEHGQGTEADYSPYSSRWMFERSRTKLILAPAMWFESPLQKR